jgi:hypothetical protein
VFLVLSVEGARVGFQRRLEVWWNAEGEEVVVIGHALEVVDTRDL